MFFHSAPLYILSFCVLFLSLAKVSAKEPPFFSPTSNDFGGIGLMQMPTGRAAKEGTFVLGSTMNKDYSHYFTSMQIMPWLETTLRYTQTDAILYSNNPNFSDDTHYTDKSIDLKFRMMKESYWWPEISLGFRDMIGTGLFDSEYLAATKRAGHFDFTLGVGWGYIGNSANLKGDKSLHEDCNRKSAFKGKGGQLDYERWFTGCASVFAGIEYQTPLKNVRLKVEYDSNDYKSDFITTQTAQRLPQDNPINVGLLYQLGEWGSIKTQFERGNTWTLGFNLKTNFHSFKPLWKEKPNFSYEKIQPKDVNDIEWEKIKDTIQTHAGFKDASIHADNKTVTLFGEPSQYRNRDIAYEKASRILLNSGSTATKYQFIEQKSKLLISQTNLDAPTYKKIANQEYIGAKIGDATSQTPPRVTPKKLQAISKTKEETPWSFHLSPTLQQSLGGSESFYLFNVGLTAGANYWLTDKLLLDGSFYLNFFDNYDQFLYDVPPDKTAIKRVRTLIRQYISMNSIRLNNLQMTAFDQFGDNVYTQTYAGYLETMFAGVGSEILYRALNSPWAWSFNLNYVAQRDPNTPWGIFKQEDHFDKINKATYQVQTGITTGHLTAYYRPRIEGFNSLLIKASVGRYLAEDKGVTLDISKQFDSGIIAGVYLSKTNLSADEFGEGSFNKGVYLSIPFDILSSQPKNQRAQVSWTPLSRDGGQALSRKYSLYDMTKGRDPHSELTLPPHFY